MRSPHIKNIFMFFYWLAMVSVFLNALWENCQYGILIVIVFSTTERCSEQTSVQRFSSIQSNPSHFKGKTSYIKRMFSFGHFFAQIANVSTVCWEFYTSIESSAIELKALRSKKVSHSHVLSGITAISDGLLLLPWWEGHSVRTINIACPGGRFPKWLWLLNPPLIVFVIFFFVSVFCQPWYLHTSYLWPAPPAVQVSKFPGWCQKIPQITVILLPSPLCSYCSY